MSSRPHCQRVKDFLADGPLAKRAVSAQPTDIASVAEPVGDRRADGSPEAIFLFVDGSLLWWAARASSASTSDALRRTYALAPHLSLPYLPRDRRRLPLSSRSGDGCGRRRSAGAPPAPGRAWAASRLYRLVIFIRVVHEALPMDSSFQLQVATVYGWIKGERGAVNKPAGAPVAGALVPVARGL